MFFVDSDIIAPPAVEKFLSNGASAAQIDWPSRLAATRTRLKRVRSPEDLAELVGTIGANPLCASG
jgi:hypothetical protein